MDPGQFSSLLASVYDASVDPAGWVAVADSAARAFDSASCLLQVQNRLNGSGQVLGHTSNFTADKMSAYREYYYAHDLWAKRALELGIGRPVLGPDLVPEPEIYSTELYNDWLRPTGIFHLVGGSVALAAGNVGLVGIHRPQDQARFTLDDRHWMGLFLEHFGRAVDLQHRLCQVELRLNATHDALERLDVGVLVVNTWGRVVYASSSAEAQVQQRNGIVLQNQVLSLTDPSHDSELKRLIHGASLGAVGKSMSSGGLMKVPRRDATPLILLICPLSPGFLGLGATDPVAMIFIGDAQTRWRPPQVVLSKLYGFSAAEGQLACALLAGDCIQDYAQQTGVSINTVRSQLKSIFAKTGHARQSALIRDLANNPVLRMMQS
jgi:DNA-binding CsgD family transcriptional regulator